MDQVKKTITILNLATELSPELSAYISEKKLNVITIADYDPGREITHLLTKDEREFSYLKKRYQTVAKNIKIISLSPVDELEDFVGSNGKLILQEVWLQNGFGHFILDKFFQDYGGISLTDNFPVFKEKGSFNIANPFNTGEYLDRMVHSAFESGVSALSAKTFFDHIVMYLVGLKNKGKVGLPLEVTYGNFEGIFGVQIHFFSQDLILEDLTLSLSKQVSKRAEEYLLNVSVDSSDFFDFTFLQEVNKAIITALWTKDERIKVENRGLLISELSTSATIAQYPTEGLTSFQLQQNQIEDLSDRIVLPAKPRDEIDELTRLAGSGLDDEGFQRIQGTTQDLTEEMNRLKGNREQAGDEAQLVKGQKELDQETLSRIKGAGEKESSPLSVKRFGSSESSESLFGLSDENQLIKGSHNPDSSRMTVKTFGTSEGSKDSFKLGTENTPIGISKNKNSPYSSQNSDGLSLDFTDFSGVSSDPFETDQDDEMIRSQELNNRMIQHQKAEILKVKSIKDPMPPEVKKRFQEHLAKNQIRPDQASQEDFEEFKAQEIKELEEKSIFNQEKHFVKGTETLSPAELIRVRENPAGPAREKNLIGSASAEKVTSQMGPLKGERQPTSAPDKLNLNQDKMLMTNHMRADQSQVDPTQAPGRDQKMLALIAENENLKSKMKTLASEVKILKDSRAQMAEIHKRAMEATAIATHGESDNKADLLLKEQMLQKLKEQRVFSDQDSRKYLDLMEREKNILKESKEIENKFKKLQIESNQKETFFSQEIEKIQRQLKAKDLVVLKTKESMMKIVERKDEDLLALQEKLNQTVRAMESLNPQAQAAYIKDLERKLSTNEKMIEIYKEKLTQKPVAKSEDDLFKEENKKLMILNNQVKNQLEGAKREIQKLQERASQDSALVMNLKAEKLKLEQAAKKASLEVKKEELTNNNQPALEHEVKRLKGLCDFYEAQIKEAQARQRDSEAKYQASLKLQKKEVIGDEAGKGKMGQLENNVRKLTQDLMESRNLVADMKKEATKLKQEKIALQNQLDNLKKSTDKSKGAAPKKPGPGGKAA